MEMLDLSKVNKQNWKKK